MTEHSYPEIKIIDFGLARQIKDGEQICLIVGTPEYVGTSSEFEVKWMPKYFIYVGFHNIYYEAIFEASSS